MISDDLFNKILIIPSRTCNQLNILTGYASPAMANRHLPEIPHVSINLILGMVPYEGMGIGNHNGFKFLQNNSNKFDCSYLIIPPAIHMKSYIWLKNGIPKFAFTGSGNYSQNAFFGGTVESFAEDDPNACYALFNDSARKTINCLDKDIDTEVKFYENIYKRNYVNQGVEVNKNVATGRELPAYKNCVCLSLLNKYGEMHNAGAGLNWGQPTLTRKRFFRDEAYIPVPANIARSGFFPDRRVPFTMLTDDEFTLYFVVAQDGNKALETTFDNSIMGRYFRRRLSVPLGEFITKDHLINYGRTDIEIYKISNEKYFMDFSV